MMKMINYAEKVDCRAFVSEKFFCHFSEKTFSAESVFLSTSALAFDFNRLNPNPL
jgi:hypothetical protein